jgi:magnesium-transporting ATPase (P-type)
MLWVNLIMDTFAALALATEKPTEDMFERKPYSRDESIMNEIMWRNILGQSFYQITVILIMLFCGSELFNLPYDLESTPFYADADYVAANPTYTEWDPTPKCYLYTMVFQVFVFMQVFNLLNARSLEERSLNIFKNLFSNGLFFIIIIIIVGGQLLMVNFGGRAMRCVALDN